MRTLASTYKVHKNRERKLIFVSIKEEEKVDVNRVTKAIEL